MLDKRDWDGLPVYSAFAMKLMGGGGINSGIKLDEIIGYQVEDEFPELENVLENVVENVPEEENIPQSTSEENVHEEVSFFEEENISEILDEDDTPLDIYEDEESVTENIYEKNTSLIFERMNEDEDEDEDQDGIIYLGNEIVEDESEENLGENEIDVIEESYQLNELNNYPESESEMDLPSRLEVEKEVEYDQYINYYLESESELVSAVETGIDVDVYLGLDEGIKKIEKIKLLGEKGITSNFEFQSELELENYTGLERLTQPKSNFELEMEIKLMREFESEGERDGEGWEEGEVERDGEEEFVAVHGREEGGEGDEVYGIEYEVVVDEEERYEEEEIVGEGEEGTVYGREEYNVVEKYELEGEYEEEVEKEEEVGGVVFSQLDEYEQLQQQLQFYFPENNEEENEVVIEVVAVAESGLEPEEVIEAEDGYNEVIEENEYEVEDEVEIEVETVLEEENEIDVNNIDIASLLSEVDQWLLANP